MKWCKHIAVWLSLLLGVVQAVIKEDEANQISDQELRTGISTKRDQQDLMLKHLSSNIKVKRTMAALNTSQEGLELSKMCASKEAIQERTFEGNLVIGIGSGSTVVYAVKFIAESIKAVEKRAEEEGRKSNLNVTCIPSSFQAQQLILENKLNLGSLDVHREVDWTIDGADEIDSQMNLIKGGGGCLTQEKILAAASKKFYIAADHTKSSFKFGESWKKGIPIEVIPISHVNVKHKIETCLGGNATLRIGIAKSGPVITDNGNFILDWKFPENTCNWSEIEVTIKMISGVVEVGLFLNMATKVYIGSPSGDVKILSKES